MSDVIALDENQIQNRIFTIRGLQIMIDRDLAELYGVEPKRLNEQVKRNIERFPSYYRFQLTQDEKNELVANCDRFKMLKHSSSLPYAQASIVLIDNYVDESVLTLLSKRAENCKAVIYTKTLSKQLQLDLKKHNEQYPTIEIKTFKEAHDRFLILDEKDIYHFGASLKDLGKKWFAFSKFDRGALEVLGRLA